MSSSADSCLATSEHTLHKWFVTAEYLHRNLTFLLTTNWLTIGKLKKRATFINDVNRTGRPTKHFHDYKFQ